MPSEFGPWPAIHKFFNRLSKDGYFEFLEDLLISGHAAEAVFMDSTHCKVHQHCNGPGSPEDQAIGKSRGGLNTKIHLFVDVLVRLAAPIVVTSGNVSDITVAPVLLEDVEDTAVAGHTGYDSRELHDSPLESWREVRVTGQRTARGYAHTIRWLCDEVYPAADKIVLMQDNLNTHTPASLYEAFGPSEALRFKERIEWHYTPKHGSWLNMAEIEIGVAQRQCLSRRLARANSTSGAEPATPPGLPRTASSPPRTPESNSNASTHHRCRSEPPRQTHLTR